jgi:hypothetical protein
VATPAEAADVPPTVVDAEVEVERDLEEAAGDRAPEASMPEPATPHPEPDAEVASPAPELVWGEVEGPEPNGDADMSPAVQDDSRHQDLSQAAGNGDRSNDEAEESTSSGGGKRRRRLFRRGGS